MGPGEEAMGWGVGWTYYFYSERRGESEGVVVNRRGEAMFTYAVNDDGGGGADNAGGDVSEEREAMITARKDDNGVIQSDDDDNAG